MHTYGKAEIIADEYEGIRELEKMINEYEQAFMQQWKNIPMDVKLKLFKGIVPFRIVVNDIQAKEKLSQNKNYNERQRIIDALGKSNHSSEREIATYMRKKQ